MGEGGERREERNEGSGEEGSGEEVKGRGSEGR